jgi:hypothetical protein
MAVKECNPAALAGSLGAHSLKELWVETDVAMALPVSRFREERSVHQRRQATNTIGWRPEGEEEILLAIVPDQMSSQRAVDLARDGYVQLVMHC